MTAWPYHLFRQIPEKFPADCDVRWLADVANLSLHPPFPWGQILYAKLLRERGNELTGDFAECGVALGGMSLFLAQHARRLGRRLYAFDSFVGLPEPSPQHDNPYFQKGDYRANRNEVGLQLRFEREIRRRSLDETIQVIPGFLEDTLQAFDSPESYAFVHIDLDLYGPVHDALEFFYPRLVGGGILVIDDFFHHARGPARAAETFFTEQGISPIYHVSFPYSVVLFKGEQPSPDHRRSVDGNRYSFALLRALQQLRACVEEACADLKDVPDQLAAAEALRGILQRSAHNSADIYEYWSCMSRYWDDMDVPTSGRRPAIEL